MQINGIVENIIYYNSENHYCVFVLDSEKGEVNVVGTFPMIAQGERLKIDGDVITHSKYGKQFKAASFVSVEPEDINDIYSFLSSGVIEGIGEVKAFDLISEFGEDVLDVLENTPSLLTKVKGIGPKTALAASKSYKEQKEIKDVLTALSKYGISTSYILKLYEKYGGGAVNIVKKNPYLLIDDFYGIGFKKADMIASKVGINQDNSTRVRAGILHILNSLCFEYGNSYVEMNTLKARAGALLFVEEAVIDFAIEKLELSGEIVVEQSGENTENRNVYLKAVFECENDVADDLHRLLVLEKSNDTKEANRFIESVCSMENLHEKQLAAVKNCFDSSVSVITGGPGTGKTTVIKTIISVFEHLNMSYALAAPTGRAAKRMSESTMREAKTIHRLLKYNPSLAPFSPDAFGYNRDEKLSVNAVIVDEMSMVDIMLFSYLLCALKNGTRLILVGDKDQLPSISVGKVLSDVIESGAFPVSTLTKVYRQSEGGSIAENAHLINKGVLPKIDKNDTEFSFKEISSQEGILEEVKNIFRSYMNATGKEKKINPKMDVQVLCPMKNGVLGVNNLNVQLQALLNPVSASKAEIPFSGGILRMGDKVMQMKNNYKLQWRNLITFTNEEGVFNGDMGFVNAIDKKERKVSVIFDYEREAIYSFDELSQLSLSYAVTVHKSQGSEFPVVLLPFGLAGNPDFFTRNLLYTAVSRAKERVVIISKRMYIENMVRNNRSSKRSSTLAKRIEEKFCK